jgi:hypothetical protein
VDSAAILELTAGFKPDLDDPVAHALIQRARADAAIDAQSMSGRLCSDPAALQRTASLVVFALGAERRPGPDALAAVFRCMLLVDAFERRLEQLVETNGAPDGVAARDLEALPAAATGHLSSAVGPLSAWVLEVRSGFVALPGWGATGDLLAAALANCVDGLLSELRLRGLGPAWTAVDRTATTVALAVRACSLALQDDTELRQPAETETALRLAADVLGTARDLGRGDDAYASERVAGRLGLPASIVRMTPDELRRVLRATFELKLHDLAETLDRVDATAPWRGLVARTTAAWLALDPCASRSTTEPLQPLPSRTEVMGMLREVARREGPITSDARALLRRMDTHLHDFETLIERIEEDAVIDFEELGQLRTTRQAILEDLLRVALADNEITDDEHQLLVRAIELLPALR